MIGGNDRDRGFSLVELILAFSLIVFLAMIGVTNLHDIIPATRANRAVKGVANLLEWARWKAVRDNAAYRIVVDAEQARMIVYKEEKDLEGEIILEEVRRLNINDTFPGIIFGVADGVIRTSGCRPADLSGLHLLDNQLKFKPTGTADRCGSLYLMPEVDLPDRKDRIRAISILLTTGRVQLWIFDPHNKTGCNENGKWLPL